MITRIIIALVAMTAFASSGRGVDYCRAKMCAYTNAHTFCQYSGRSTQCTGYIHATLSQDEKTQILARLNRRRNDVAAGRMRGLPPASNMMKLRWVGELEKEAQLWADQCRPPRTPEEQDACRDLFSVSVGQCAASVVGEAPGLRAASMVDMWFMQGALYRGNVSIYEQPQTDSKHYYGDFAQMMCARSYMVGCGRSRFMQDTGGRFRTIERLVCNFAPRGPAPYRSLWSLGAPAAACPPRSRPDSSYTALCDYQYEWDDSLDKNSTMSLEEQILLNAVLEIERNNSESRTGFDEMYYALSTIASVSDSIGTAPRVESMQKRDIGEKIAFINLEVDNANEVNMFTETKDINQTVALQLESTPTVQSKLNTITKAPKKKLKLIGRPRSYNVEELSGIGGDKRENLGTSEETHKRKALFDIDDEYNTIEDNNVASDRNTETTTDEKNLNTLTVQDISTARTIEFFENMTSLGFEVVTISTLDSADIKYDMTTESARVNLNMTFDQLDPVNITNKPNEDYLLDPDTAGELQAALERLERAGHDNTFKHVVKSRRALRDVPRDDQNSLDQQPDPNRDQATQDQTNSSDRSPMIKMVMRYMPYLQKYQQDLLGSSVTSRDHGFLPSIILVLLLALIYV